MADPESYHLVPVWIELAGVPSAIGYVKIRHVKKQKQKLKKEKASRKEISIKLGNKYITATTKSIEKK